MVACLLSLSDLQVSHCEGDVHYLSLPQARARLPLKSAWLLLCQMLDRSSKITRQLPSLQGVRA